MDRIKENESENTTVRALVVNVTYKVSLSDAQVPQDVLDGLKEMLNNTISLPDPEELAFDEKESLKIASRWLSDHIHENESFQREYEIEWITK